MSQSATPGVSLDEVRAVIAERDPHTVHAALGIRTEKLGQDEVVVAVDVDERLFQHAGIVHGGIYVLLAESAASCCAALNVDMTKFVVAGQEVSASHLRRVTEGVIRASATPIKLGKTASVFDCRVTDGDDQLVSWVRLTIAIRPLA